MKNLDFIFFLFFLFFKTMSRTAVSVELKNERRMIRKAKESKRDGLVDSPNDEVGMHRLYMEEIMSKA